MSDIAVQKPSSEVISIETAQNRICLLTAQAFRRGFAHRAIQAQIAGISAQAEQGFNNPKLERDIRMSLLRFGLACYMVLDRNLTSVAMNEATGQNNAILEHFDFDSEAIAGALSSADRPPFPPHYWHGRQYIKERVHPVMEELAQMRALDPNDTLGRNSLRNLAEMEVRYQNHNESIAYFRERGDKLVRAGQHEDCSDRCLRWQGRLYSLDGTSGTAESGEQYVPLEIATEIGDGQEPSVQYTTKAGVKYNNGLLGFNCRHRLLEYHPDIPPPEPVTKEEQKEQYAINQKQRKLERQTRHERLRAELYKGTSPEAYKESAAKAKKLTAEYKSFCKSNNRAFYPERLQIIKPELKGAKIGGKLPPNNTPQGLTSASTGDILNTSTQSLDMSTLELSYGAVHTKSFEALLRQAPPDIQAVWNKYAVNIRFSDVQSSKIPAYDLGSRDIKINLGKELQDNRWVGERFHYTGHEIGHLIDHSAGTRFEFFSSAYNGGIMESTIKQEAAEHIQSIHDRLKSEAVARGGRASSVSIWDARREVAKELTSHDGRVSGIASDIFEGATNGKVVGSMGHGARYWKTHLVSPEAFAHFFGASITNTMALAYAKKRFPKTYNIFLDIVRDMARR